jgi:Icc-related predicted phosphoesterase
LPWHIQDLMAKLTKAFKDKKNEILFIAGDLGHYIADGHMPLHTSDNHDGQNTNQNSLVGKSFARVVCKDYKFNVPQVFI